LFLKKIFLTIDLNLFLKSMIIANEIRVGNVIMYQNDMWRVVKTEHVKPGKGGAFIQAELKNLSIGTKTDTRFRSDEKIEKLEFMETQVNFLYSEQDTAEFMDMQTYEQISVSKALIGEKIAFLKEEMSVRIAKAGDRILDVILPEHITMEIAETQPYMKGQTITSSFKPATLINGVVINVPQFVEAGELVVVKPETLEYMERAKK
jgi:elongation factor P